MALNFPSSPSLNQSYTLDSKTWIWNGYAWDAVAAVGYTGSQGATGFTGSQGPQGASGFTGSQGTSGFTGSRGIQGDLGYTGSQGDVGFTGSQGIQGDIGYTGSQGSQGIQGFTGSQGIQGDIGYTGSQGSQGIQGFTGSQGVVGFTGSQGGQGIQGFTGSQGGQGIQGFTGSQGSQGIQGFTGSQGIQGIQGFTGSQGSQGIQGFTGSQGVVGFTGSQGHVAGLQYNFSTTTTDADPGAGIFRFNNATIGSVTSIFIDLLSVDSVDQTNFIDTWDDSTNTVKGYVVIDSNDNADVTHAVFQLNTITTATGYRKLNVTYLSGTIPSNAERCAIQFYRAGNVGFTGSQGIQGFTGSQGIQGIQGFTGSQGIQGIQGFTGSQGSQGIQGFTGSQGSQGIQGFTGSQGSQGTTGFTGSRGDTGFTGSQGSQGIQGFTGSQGVQGFTGSRGDTGFTGSIGFTGSASSVTIVNDLATNVTQYVGMSRTTSGSWSTAYVADVELYFNPSTGTLNAVNFNSLSDQMYKEGIVRIVDPLTSIQLIDGVEFVWKKSGVKSAGVVAQQVERVLPWLVEQTDGRKTVNYPGLIAYLIEAIKDQQQQIDQLRQTIDSNK